MSSTSADERPPTKNIGGVARFVDRRACALAGACVVLALLGVGLISPYALFAVFLDGLLALLVVLPAVLAGLWLVPSLGLGTMPRRWHVLLGAALGLGTVSLLVMLLGLAGCLQRPLWVGVICLLLALGALGLRRLSARLDYGADTRRDTGVDHAGAVRYLWLLAPAFLTLALLAASNAPGFIWQEEGYGYDVLEYHLQLPKEYIQAGRIHYTAHNVYGSFPAGVEMLYLLAMILQDTDIDAGISANMIHLLLAGLTVFAAWVAGCEWSPRAGIVAGVVTACAGWLVYLSGLAYVENGVLFFGMTATAVIMRISGFRWRIVECCDPQSAPTCRDNPQSPISNPQSPMLTRRLVVAGVIAGFACGCKYTALAMIALPLGVAVLALPGRTIRRRLGECFVFGLAAVAAFSPWLIKNQVMTGNPVFPLMNGLFEASPRGWGEEQTERWNRGHSALPGEQTVKAKLRALWRHVPADRYQRFGPMIFILAIAGLLRRRRDAVDLVLVIVLLVQLAVWLFATHLYARFAIVLLIPLALLAGRSMLGATSAARRRLILTITAVGAAWNFAFAADLIGSEHATGAPASLIYDGKLRGYEYLNLINGELPSNARILLVGDARAFYFRRNVDYCVVFNRSPFVEAVRSARSDREIVNWLRRHGYTHVLVNWSEIKRLRATYGFAEEMNESLFERLSDHGLSPLRNFEHPRSGGRYVTLYELPVAEH